MPLHIENEANRCLQCKKPMCQQGCPAYTPIPQVIALFKEHKLMEAGKMLFDNNPMSLVCSMVCHHAGQCYGHCVLNDQGRPVGVEGEDELIPADTTIIAISQGPKDKLVNTTHGLKATERGLLIVDENNMTTREGVFAAGDVVHGSLTVVHAVNDAKNAAAAMMRYMEKIWLRFIRFTGRTPMT